MEEKTNRCPGRAAGTAEQHRAVQELAQSGEAQKLLSMLKQTGEVQQAAQAAAQGAPEQLLGLVRQLMNPREGADIVERLRRQAERSGLS